LLWLQVIEIRQSDSIPGVFTVWAMTGQSDLRKIQLRVNRSFYVNARPDVDVTTTTGDATSSSKSHAIISKSGVRVTRQLPHGRPAHHLIQVNTLKLIVKDMIVCICVMYVLELRTSVCVC
jgi:hypothetical protein